MARDGEAVIWKDSRRHTNVENTRIVNMFGEMTLWVFLLSIN